MKVIPEGERYEAKVPDTLDLAERARLAINGLLGQLDPELDYELCENTWYSKQPYLSHDFCVGLPLIMPKTAEALPMMRIMSGSDQDLNIEEGMMKAMLANIAEDGLYYAPAREDRPWHLVALDKKIEFPPEDYASVYGTARMMLAMMAWYQRDHDPAWLDRLRKMAEKYASIAVYKDDYAYYPMGGPGKSYLAGMYPKSGWKSLKGDDIKGEQEGEEEGSLFMFMGGSVRAFTRWYIMSGDPKALETARKLVNFLIQPKFWGDRIKPRTVVSHEHAQWWGHFHGHMEMLRSLLEYAVVTKDAKLKEFVRQGYAYVRNFGIPRIGWFPDMIGIMSTNQGCGAARITALAIKLCDAGVGDYWDDVDQYIRNQGTEQQLLRADILRQICSVAPELEKEPGTGRVRKPKSGSKGVRWEVTDRVIERTVGAFAANGLPTQAVSVCMTAGCCTTNGSTGLYYAWEAIVRCKDDVAQINLLLNRASPWLDVDSYLPYEGKVVVKNKTAKKILLRIPLWVDKKAVEAHVDGTSVKPFWINNYLFFDNVKAKAQITVTFPMVETTEKYTLYGKEYTCHFKGNTLIDISPHDAFFPDLRILAESKDKLDIWIRNAFFHELAKDKVEPADIAELEKQRRPLVGNCSEESLKLYRATVGYPFYQRDYYRQNRAPMKKVARFVPKETIKW
jgi:hypothetical protein